MKNLLLFRPIFFYLFELELLGEQDAGLHEKNLSSICISSASCRLAASVLRRRRGPRQSSHPSMHRSSSRSIALIVRWQLASIASFGSASSSRPPPYVVQHRRHLRTWEASSMPCKHINFSLARTCTCRL